MNQKKILRKLFEDVSCEFRDLGTKHSKMFVIALEEHVEDLEGIDSTDYLTNYFKACVKKHGNNLGCNQAIKMLESGYKKIYKMTV
ncbi:conserved hypothetical protein [Vibrio phage 424E50-1]|nr:conserved hypothetical protein [Vibrio phage 424E50-1]